MYKRVTFGLAVLIVWLGTTSLVMSNLFAAHSPVAACHHPAPVPTSSQPHTSDHSCCAVGHNQTLPPSKIEAPPLELGNLVEGAAVRQAWTAANLLELTLADAGPPLMNNSPIRI
jgi:hypothetical protein